MRALSTIPWYALNATALAFSHTRAELASMIMITEAEALNGGTDQQAAEAGARLKRLREAERLAETARVKRI